MVAGNINISAIIVWTNLIKSFFGSWPGKGPEFVYFIFYWTK